MLDFGSETMTAFRTAPQVGDVVLSSESEKVINLFKMLQEEVQYRRKLFADFGGDYSSYCSTSGSVVPNIVVIINNYAALNEMYEQFEEMITYLTREGTKYGIFFVMTAANTNAVRYRLLQNFKQLLVMQLNDKSEYAGVLGSTDGTFPSKAKGRGVFKKDKVYEFQTACITDKENLFNIITDFCENLKEKTTTRGAKPIPILPEKVTVESFRDADISVRRVPIGIDKQTLEAISWNLSTTVIHMVGSQDGEGIGTFMQGMAEMISKELQIETCVLDTEKCFVDAKEEEYQYIDDNFEAKVITMFQLLVERNNNFKAGIHQELEQVLYIIPSLTGLMGRLSTDGIDKMKNILDKNEANYNVNFIIGDTGNFIQKHSIEARFKKHMVGNGLWIGNGFNDQYQFKVSKITGELSGNITSDFGVYANKGKSRIVKLISSQKEMGKKKYEKISSRNLSSCRK